MKTISKCFFLFFCLLISCKTGVNKINIETVPEELVVGVSDMESKDNCVDCFNYRVIDTIENGKAVRITYFGRNKLKKNKNKASNYKDGKLLSITKDTIIEGIKLFSKKETNGDETIVTNFEKNNSKKEYESVYKFKNGKLVYQIIVSINKSGDVIEKKDGFNEKEEIITSLRRKHLAFQYPKENQNNEVTEYYKSGKKYQWSKLIYTSSKVNNESQVVRFEILSYYDLKNNLMKKEFFKDSFGTVVEVFGSEGTKIVQKIDLLKTEWYKDGKLIKTLENKIL